MSDNHNEVALVTGAARRIGAEIIRELHSRGLQVAVHYKNSAAEARALVDELNKQRPDSAYAFKADLGDVEKIKAMAAEITQRFGRLDLLVHNASNFFPTPIETASETQFHQLLDGNLKGAYFLTQALLPLLKKSRGNIVTLVDIHARRPLAKHSIYCAAKAGLQMLTMSLARELAPDIRVNGVAPGSILWPEEGMDDNTQAEILQRIPLKRQGQAADIARAVCFLGLEADYVTGQILNVDGGRSLMQ